jgi:pimeloyl-ACP methyl ester carboxylesterase
VTNVRRACSIGPIVASSLLCGFAAALVLVLGPVAGAREDVISGTVLLTFAAGWALLAVLSVRWTDQPQPWALVPAGLMAVLGAGDLVFAPGAGVLDALGWMWPIVVPALVVWMLMQSRRHLRSRTRPLLLYPVFAGLILAAVGGGFETVKESLDRNAYAMSGRLIDVGGHRLHISCIGSGSPTVVLEGGFGETSAMWGWIAPTVARDTRVCVYDRAGRGWSEPASGPQDGAAVAGDLYTLLDHARIAGPYVLVGHSFGGLYVLNFAARYPRQVAGMVLLDSTSPEAFTKLPGYPGFYEAYRRATGLFPSFARLGVARLVNATQFTSLPAPSRNLERAFGSTAQMTRSQRDEWAEAPTAMKQAQALKSLGDKPLIVITAVKDAQVGWMPLQDALARLSTNSMHRLMPQATHTSLTDNETDAAASSQAILDVVTSVQAAKPLARS